MTNELPISLDQPNDKNGMTTYSVKFKLCWKVIYLNNFKKRRISGQN